jgi:hypothetical protein
MKIDYSFTREYGKAVWKQFRGYTTISIANVRVWYVAAPTIGLTLLLSGVYSGYVWLQPPGSLLLFSSLVSIPIHIAFDRWKFSNWFKDNFSSYPEKESYSLIANDDGLIVAKSDSIETRLAWNAITNFRQNETITVMYLSPDNLFYFPTKAMTTEQREELDDLVARNMVKKNP